MRRMLRHAVAVLALTSPLLTTTQAHAAEAAHVGFAGTITFGQVPCPTGCSAFFASTVAVGTVTTSFPASGLVTAVSAGIGYEEPGCVAGVASPTSAGTITFTLTGVSVVGSSLPWTLGTWDWLRVGNHAVINPLSPVGWLDFATLPPCSGAWTTWMTGGLHYVDS